MGVAGAILGSAVIGGVSASKAASAQKSAADAQVDLARETRDLTRQDLSPYYDAGQQGLNALQYELGLGAQPQGYNGFQATPGYQFALDEGLNAVEGSAAAAGGLYSGATMQALQERGTGLANQEYGNYVNRLTSLAGSGQNAAAGMGAANQAYSNQAGNALGAYGNAAAAGAIGVGNAVNQGIGNYLGYQQFNQLMQQPQNYAPMTSPTPMQRPYG